MYAVLREHDLVSIVDAPGNDAVVRIPIELGVRAGIHSTTLPTIPVLFLDDWPDDLLAKLQAGIRLEPPMSDAP